MLVYKPTRKLESADVAFCKACKTALYGAHPKRSLAEAVESHAKECAGRKEIVLLKLSPGPVDTGIPAG